MADFFHPIIHEELRIFKIVSLKAKTFSSTLSSYFVYIYPFSNYYNISDRGDVAIS